MAMSATILPLLLVFLFNLAYAEILNIDCGSAGPHFNNITKLSWVSDDKYVRGGETRTTSEKEPQTLRAFPKNKKNCYTIPVAAARKVMVRTRFRYGNYDRRGKPPSFKLQFDGNDWFTVETEIDTTVTYTIIYETRRNRTDICVGRLYDDQEPFVTYIQVSTLESTMYDKVDPSYALYNPVSYAFGAQERIRSPDDPYDRWWLTNYTNIAISRFQIQNSSRVSAVSTSTSGDNPPLKLFDSCILPTASQTLIIRTDYIGSSSSQIYLNMYFTEMAEAAGGRTFRIYQDSKPISDVLTVPSGSVLDFPYVTNASGSSVFGLAATADATLPPLINGLQIFYIYAFSNRLTNSKDMEVLAWLQGNFTILRNWTGDPCLPLKYNWEWIKCNSDDSPRVTKLYLGGYGLSGPIPDFSALEALLTIDLHNNTFSGSVPEFFANFPYLQVLNLADNDFSSVPSALTKNTTVIVNVTGNPRLCKEGRICIYGPFSSTATLSPPPPSNGSSKLITSAFSTILTILAIIGTILM